MPAVFDSALIRTLALALVAVALLPAAARADTFEVNTTADTVGTTGCPAMCTIRNAINAAAGNGNAVDDTIVVPAGTYSLDLQLGALTVPMGATRITIDGAGANTTLIQPAAGVAARVLAIDPGAAVTLTDLTLRNGSVTTGQGGNLLVGMQATATLNRVRVTGGSAPQGGGIGATGATALTIQSSLIDANTASGTSGVGGGIFVLGQTTATQITIQDSTITANSASNGGGIGIQNNAGQPPTLRGVTLARNTARAGQVPGNGGISSTGTNARFQGSIIAGNTTTINFGSGSTTVPANCSLATAASDDGGNITPDTDQCGLAGSHADPLLATALDETQQPPVLAIPANSPAVDIADCGARTVDQRGVARPQLNACDAGAFEYQPPPPPPPPPPTPTATPAPTAVPTPTVPPTVTPVAGKSVGARPVSGKVLVKLPKAKRFVALDPSVIGNGAEVDARKGVVEITRSDGGVAKFYGGIFKLSQPGGITTMTLSEKLTGCPKPRKSSASAAAKKPKSRKLWGDGKGKFRTKGSYSAATVRGTKWLVTDTCTTTRTRVAQGVVRVRDEVKKKTVTLRKGKSYIARAKR